MHRPWETPTEPTPFVLWLRACGWPSLILAVAWAVTGRMSFLLDVDHVLVTPIFFIPEAFALAFALRFGAGVWPGIFVGHQVLIWGRDLPVLAGLGVSTANTLEAVLAVWLFRRLQGSIDMDNVRSWALLQAMVFLVLQPFCATLGTASLLAGGVIGDPQAWLAAGLNWWSGSGMAQSQLAPLLLILLHPHTRVSWAKQIVLPALVTVAALVFGLFVLGGGGIGASLVLFQPLLVAFALLLGLPAVCIASALISVAFLYATSHGQGPFYFGEATSLFDLNVFLIGISLISQFLAVLFRQLAKQRETEEQLRDAREQLQASHRKDLEEKLKTSIHAAAVAHEINQPLSSILLQSKMALQEENEARDALRIVAEEAQRVVVTIDKMKTLMRNVQTGHKPVDLAAVTQSALLYNKGLLARRQITVQQEGLDDEYDIMGDDEQLQLAITNILRNSAEAIDESHPSERVIEVELTARDNEVELTIGDSGPGWTGAERSDVPLTSTKKGGTGIGLYVVRTAVQNHNGKIAFGKSTLGGAEVKLTFPRAEKI